MSVDVVYNGQNGLICKDIFLSVMNGTCAYMGEQSDKNTVHSANVLFVSAIYRAARNHMYVLIIVQQK